MLVTGFGARDKTTYIANARRSLSMASQGPLIKQPLGRTPSIDTSTRSRTRPHDMGTELIGTEFGAFFH